MRLTGQIRYEEGLKTPSDLNSTYRVSHPAVPEHTVSMWLIPFVRMYSVRHADSTRSRCRANSSVAAVRTKTHALAPQKRQTYMQARAVVMDPEEKKAVALLQQIQTLNKDKVARRRAKQEERRAEHSKDSGKVDRRRRPR